MKSVIHKPLWWYVEKIEHNESFSLARYGDGELYCIWGREGENSHGCKYSPELRKSLQESLHAHITDPKFIYGLQRVLEPDAHRIMSETRCVWYGSELFGDELVNGRLYPLFEILRKRRVVVFANAECSGAARKILPDAGNVVIPRTNSYNYKGAVYQAFEYYMRDNRQTIFLFSAGMGATAFVHELHGIYPLATLIDFGHIWDAFAGENSRCNLEGIDPEIIAKNLCPTQPNNALKNMKSRA